MNRNLRLLLLLALPSAASAQTVEFVIVSKMEFNEQTSATQVSLITGLPYGIDMNIDGADMDLLSPAPTVTGPITNPEPGHNGGVLGYNLDDEYWRYGFPNFDDWGTDTRTELDGLFGSGTYTFSVAGLSVPLNLTGDLYSASAPVHTLSGGSWSGGVYVLDAGQPLSITTSAYAEYGTHVEDAIYLDIQGSDYEDGLTEFASSQNQNFLTLVVPANTLTPGNTYSVEAGFIAGSDFNTSIPGLPGAIAAATYDRSTCLTVEVTGGPSIAVVCDPANDHTQGNYTKLDTSTLGAPGGGFSGLHLEATDGPSGEFGYFLVSSGANSSFAVSNGVLCLDGPQGRYAPAAGATLNSIGSFDGAGRYASIVQAQQGWDVPTVLPAPPGGSISPGTTLYFQMWYRDGQRSNFSNAIGVTF